ncbi:MAG: hypothetical protein JKY87_05310 [Mariprofundus sp.]|nr:hypothetical protein [Mariprofundus sp.]
MNAKVAFIGNGKDNVINLFDQHQEKPIHIKTFDGFSIRLNGRCVQLHEWKGKKVYQLLLFLIASGGKNVSSDTISDIIWPDADGDKAMQSFEFSLRRLRNVLQKMLGSDVKGIDLIPLDEGKLSLNPEYCSLDSWTWETYCNQATTARREGNLAKAFRLEQSAADMLQGEFLPGENDIIFTQQESWRRRCTHWISHTASLWMEHAYSSDVDVMPLLDKGVKIDPYSEKICMQSMRALLNEGYTVDAMRLFHTWAKLIKGDLGINPSVKVSALYSTIAN